MNDDLSPSVVAREPQPAPDNENAHEQNRTDHDTEERPASGSPTLSQPAPAASSTTEVTRRQRRRAGLAKKLQFLIHLLKNLDMLFFAELCVLYYMECSLPRLVLRALPHYLFFTPKADTFLQSLAAQRPQVFAIFAPNTLCILAHFIWGPPRASEATRGYLHGGIIVDFIGQKAPSSRFSLLLLDFVILGIQCVMLAVHQESEKLWKVVRPRTATSAVPSGEPAPAAAASTVTPTIQDHDAEERGESRDLAQGPDDSDEIELQPLVGSNGSGAGTGLSAGTADRRGIRRASRTVSSEQLTETLVSGNAVLADLHVINSIRMASNDYQSAAAYSLQSLGYTATLAALAAERRARFGAQPR